MLNPCRPMLRLMSSSVRGTVIRSSRSSAGESWERTGGSSRCGALVVPTPIKGVMFSEHHSLLYR